MALSLTEATTVTDSLNRPLRDLRISVTDRCNFRCVYCMPKEVFGPDYSFLSREELLTFDEVERVARACVELGVGKIRLTGGEPMLRPKLPRLITRLSGLPGIDDLTMTTNGTLLIDRAQQLKEAGLNRVSVSLDALEDEVFAVINDVGAKASPVLEGIEAAAAAGLEPVKVNMVVERGLNDDQILPMVRYFRGTNHILRFIEFMDVGTTNEWRLEKVVPAAQVLEMIDREYPLEPVESRYYGEVANRYRFRDGAGEIGMVASVTQPFCGDCTRMRLSADGKLYTCLFAISGHNLRASLRAGAGVDDLTDEIRGVWERRTDRYSEERSERTEDLPKVEMHFIGG